METNKKIKILELFSGTESFSKVARERGHETFTIDNDPKFNPDLCKDIMEVTIKDIPFKPDIIWSSPPCQKFSTMTIYRNWEKLKDGVYKPKNEEVKKHIEIHKKGIELIKQLKPKFFFIENPRAMLRKQDFMKEFERKTVTYCQYGLEYMKATDIFTNCLTWKPRPMCSPKSPCNIRAPRGSKKGIQDSLKDKLKVRHFSTGHIDLTYNSSVILKVMRGIVPRELCLEIIKHCEENLK